MLLLPGVRFNELHSPPLTCRTLGWVIRESPFIYCNKSFMWVSQLLRRFAKSKAVDANTTYLFYSQLWNIKWSCNDSCVHLSRNLTALKIKGRGWNTDKWRTTGMEGSWIKAEAMHLCLEKLKTAPCCWFWITIVLKCGVMVCFIIR